MTHSWARWVIRAAAAVSLALSPSVLSAQMMTRMEITPRTDTATVGDSILIDVRLHLREQDALLDSVPRLADSVGGMQVLRAEPMQRQPDRAFNGRVWVAFYRTGVRTVPPFELRYRRGGLLLGMPVRSDSATVQILPVLPAGNPPLKDIRDIESTTGPNPLPIVFAVLATGILIWLLRRRRRAVAPVVAAAPVAGPSPMPTPYEAARHRLDEIAREAWPARGAIDRHYEAIVAVLREYLERAEDVPAGERTTAELLWSLPPHLTADGLRDRCHALFREADLVKFARVAPDVTAADTFLQQARALLDRWHAARSRIRETTHAAG